jgi:hypothetical protein
MAFTYKDYSMRKRRFRGDLFYGGDCTGMSEPPIPDAVEKTLKSNSYKENPIPLREDELREILVEAL